MAIVKYPEFSVKIAIKDAESGVLNNATFSGELDSQSLDLSSPTNMVAFRKKNANAKPFIWGVSNWNDKSTHYNKNDYKGIATKGNGVGAVITLVFSEPTSHFTMYFDESAGSMPLSLTIGSQAIENDDYVFSYSQDTPQTTFSFTVGEMSEVNGEKMPLMIVGVEAKIELDITHRTGLKSVRASRSFTSDREKPAYGILSQEGTLNLFDYYTELDDLINLGLLTSDKAVEIKFADNLAGSYTTDKWSEEQSNLFSVSLNDRLLQWQEKNINKKYNLELDKTAKDLYDYLVSLDSDLSFVLDDTTESHLFNIKIKYFYWEASKRWQLWQKLCDLAQLYVITRHDEKIVVISQKRINEIKEDKSNNPIIVPYTIINGSPVKNRLVNNKITGVKISENIVSVDKGEILNETFYTKNSSGSWNTDNPEIVDINGKKYWQAIREVNTSNYIMQYINFGDEEPGLFPRIIIKDDNAGGKLSGWAGIMPIWLSRDEFNFTSYPEINQCYQLNKHTNYNTTCFTFNEDLQQSNWDIYSVQVIINAIKYFINSKEIMFGYDGNVFDINGNEFFTSETKVGDIKISEYNANQILNNFNGKQTISFSCAIDTLRAREKKYSSIIIEEKNTAIYTYSWDTNWHTSYNFNDKNGKYTLSGQISVEDLEIGQTYFYDYRGGFVTELDELHEYRINSMETQPIGGQIEVRAFKTTYVGEEDILNPIIYDINNGEILQIFDVFQLQKTNGEYEPEIWQVTRVEIEASGGKNFINVEGVQI